MSSCGHDGPFGATDVKRLKSIGMIDPVPGMKALDVNTAKDTIVRLTREIFPGMFGWGLVAIAFILSMLYFESLMHVLERLENEIVHTCYELFSSGVEHGTLYRYLLEFVRLCL